jgi:hypothetical protein
MIEESQPVRRRPGRPRKEPVTAAPRENTVEAPPKRENDDERIGIEVQDPRWNAISFPDGRQYRVEDGVIVERTV